MKKNINLLDYQDDIIYYNEKFDKIFKNDIYDLVESVLKNLINNKTIIDDKNEITIYNNIKNEENNIKKEDKIIKKNLFDEIKDSKLNEIDEYEFNNLSDLNKMRYIKLNILRKKNELRKFHRENLL